MGLEWRGAVLQLSVTVDENHVRLSAEKQEKNPYLQAELFVALRGTLNETSAYRKYFAVTNDLEGLIAHQT